MKRRILVIGPSGSGKTAICNYINGEHKKLRKTQDVIFGKYTIDAPGSYLDSPSMYQHLITLALNYAKLILIIVDGSNPNEKYSHGFSKIFNCPKIGVITKYNEKNKERCEKQLENIGLSSPWFYIHEDTMVNDLENLKNYLLTLNGG